MAAAEGLVARLDGSVERLVSNRLAAPVVVCAALLVYAAVSVGLPLQAGRDLPRYLLAYAQLFDADVVYPHALVSRTPGTPLVAGVLLQAGPLAAELGAALLYALSVLAWCCVARRFGPTACVATGLALLAYPGYVLLFHELASDALFAAAFALVALLFTRAVERPTAAHAAALGLGVAAAVYARPVGQALALLGLVLAAVARGRRVPVTVAFVVGVLVPLVALVAHNGIRGDDFTVVRGGSASPLFRMFVADRIVQPGNGDASEELGSAVAAGLLLHEPYRSRRIDLDGFFSSGSSRMHDDLTVLADRTWGWDDDYRHLGRAAREAIRAHPGAYARGVGRDVWRLLLWPVYAPVDEATAAAPLEAPQRTEQAAALSDDEEPIPSSREAPYISTPDGRIREVWTSPNDHRLVFRDPADRRGAAALDAEVNELLEGLPQRDQRPGLVGFVNDLSRLYPRPFLWLLVGLVAIVWRRPSGLIVPVALAGAALVVLVATSLAVYAVAEYAVPVVPAFVLLAAVGVLGRYRPLRA